MEDHHILRIENDESDQNHRKKALADIVKVHNKFKMATSEESLDSKLDTCNRISYPILITSKLRKDGNDTKVTGEFKKFVVNKSIQRVFNKKNLKSGKNGANTFETLLPNDNYSNNLSKTYPKAMRVWTGPVNSKQN